ncbi:MAG: hypothetical protein LBS03_08940, partial [Bacteroidales bacterium]|nr:hypothetical protein [Bacteroidales bacterium]
CDFVSIVTTGLPKRVLTMNFELSLSSINLLKTVSYIGFATIMTFNLFAKLHEKLEFSKREQ